MATRKKIINKSKKDKKGKKRNGNKNKNIININVNSNNKKIGGGGNNKGGNSGGGKTFAPDKKSEVYIPPYLPNPVINTVPPYEKKDDASNLLIGYVEKNNLLLKDTFEDKIKQNNLLLKNDINNSTSTTNNYMMQDMNALYGGFNNIKLYLKQREENYIEPKPKYEDKYMAFKEDETERLRDEKDPDIETDPYAYEKITVDKSKITHDIEMIETEESLDAGYMDKNDDAFVGENPSLITTVPVDNVEDISLVVDKKVDSTSSVVDKKVDSTSSVGEKKTFFKQFFKTTKTTTSPPKKSDDSKDVNSEKKKKKKDKKNESVSVIEDIKDVIMPEVIFKKKKKKQVVNDSDIINVKQPEPEIKKSPIRNTERINIDDIVSKPSKTLVSSFIDKLKEYNKYKTQLDPEDLATYRSYVGMQSAGGNKIGPTGAIKNLKSKWNL